MENYGLLTFRSTALLFDESSSTIKDRQYVADVVAHEVAHQWTGNLVTADWWSELWLNEGFATFFETFSVDNIYPDWNHWQSFLVGTFQPLMQIDSLPGTHSLVVIPSVNDSQQIEGVFDTISYNKGGSILRMVNHYLGKERFQQWMRQYYEMHQFQNTITSDLFDVLAKIEGSNLDFSKMEQWTHNPGYPVLHLIRTSANAFKFRQERFFSAPPTADQKARDKDWWIPMTLFDSEGNVQNFDFHKMESPVFNVANEAEWIKANKGNVGIFRINYTTDMWSRLTRAMEKRHTFLQPISERFGLIDDVFALGMAGHTPMYLALDMARALQRESSFVIWSTMLNHLVSMSRTITLESYCDMFNKYMRDLVRIKLNELGWTTLPQETVDQTQLRPLLISIASLFGNESIIQQAMEKYDSMERDPKLHFIPADLRAAVYDTVVRYGGDKYYSKMLERYRKSANDVSEKNRCMYALTMARQPHLIKHTLEMTLTDEIRSQDGIFVIRSILRSSPLAHSMAWDFVRENFDEIVAKYDMRTVNGRLITSIAGLFTSQWKRRELLEFFVDKPDVSDQYLQMALQLIDANIRFLKTSGESLSKWLEERTQHLV